MKEKEAIERIYILATNNSIGKYEGSYEQAFDIIVDKLEKQKAEIEKKDKIIRELEERIEALINSEFKKKAEEK